MAGPVGPAIVEERGAGGCGGFSSRDVGVYRVRWRRYEQRLCCCAAAGLANELHLQVARITVLERAALADDGRGP